MSGGTTVNAPRHNLLEHYLHYHRANDKHIASMPHSAAEGPCYHQNILGGKNALPFPTLLGNVERSNASLMKEATPDIPGGLDALSRPALYGNLAGSNVNLNAGGRANGDSQARGEKSLYANDTAYEPADMNRTL